MRRWCAAALALCLLGMPAADAAAEVARPKVAVVTTGGTIAQKTDPATGQAVPSIGGEALLESVPGLRDLAELELVEVASIDSRDMTPSLWLRIAQAVAQAADDPGTAGVVVVHGTDTMEDTGWFLELVRDTEKPIVLTGAMRDASHPAPDGPQNLLDAVRQAADPAAAGRGVTLTLNGRIVPAAAARKTDAGNVDTFAGGMQGILGTIEGGRVHWLARPERPLSFSLPDSLPAVPMVFDYPGNDGALMDAAAADPATAGIVVVGYGIGNVSRPLFDAIGRARAKGIPVLVTSRVHHGRVRPAYGGPGGGDSLQKLGAILSPVGDPWKARIALMLALAETGSRDPAVLAGRLGSAESR